MFTVGDVLCKKSLEPRILPHICCLLRIPSSSSAGLVSKRCSKNLSSCFQIPGVEMQNEVAVGCNESRKTIFHFNPDSSPCFSPSYFCHYLRL